MKFGQKLRTLRKRRNLGQAEIAAALDVSIPSVSEWETGKKLPGRENMSKISGFFNVPVDDLLNDARENAYFDLYGGELDGENASSINTARNVRRYIDRSYGVPVKNEAVRDDLIFASMQLKMLSLCMTIMHLASSLRDVHRFIDSNPHLFSPKDLMVWSDDLAYAQEQAEAARVQMEETQRALDGKPSTAAKKNKPALKK